SYNDRHTISTEDKGSPDDGRKHGRNPQIQSPLAIRHHRRSGQTLRLSLRRAQSGSELPRPARFAGQLRRNDPPILLCNHEKIAVQIAHGYARANGKPMIAIVHDVVGLLHAPMGIYYAYLDRAPVFVIGATGPLAEPKRRPFI